MVITFSEPSSSQSSSMSFGGFEFVSNEIFGLVVSVDDRMDVELAAVGEVVF